MGIILQQNCAIHANQSMTRRETTHLTNEPECIWDTLKMGPGHWTACYHNKVCKVPAASFHQFCGLILPTSVVSRSAWLGFSPAVPSPPAPTSAFFCSSFSFSSSSSSSSSSGDGSSVFLRWASISSGYLQGSKQSKDYNTNLTCVKYSRTPER